MGCNIYTTEGGQTTHMGCNIYTTEGGQTTHMGCNIYTTEGEGGGGQTTHMGCKIYTTEGVRQLTWTVTYILLRGSGNSHGLLHIYY